MGIIPVFFKGKPSFIIFNSFGKGTDQQPKKFVHKNNIINIRKIVYLFP